MRQQIADWLTIPRIAALSILAFAILLFVLTKLTAPPEFDFLAGPEDSTFYNDALRYQEILQRSGVTLNVIATKGSLDNVEGLLASERPTAAFVDAIGAIELAEDRQPDDPAVDPEDVEQPMDRLSSLGAIYLQPIWFFTLADRELPNFENINRARLGVGAEGSTSRLIAELVRRNVRDDVTIELVEITGDDADTVIDSIFTALRSGDVHAAIAVGQPGGEVVDQVLRADDIHAAEVSNAEAYALHFPFLVPIRLPAGGHDLGAHIPEQDVSTLAASTELIVTDLFPPPLADLLLQATSEMYGGASLFAERDEFPNPDMVAIDLNSSAARYYESGPPLLRKYLPFQLATWIDRFIGIVVAFGSVAIAVFSILPKVIELHLNRQLDNCYRRMQEVERQFVSGGDAAALLAELDAVDSDSRDIRVYLKSGVSSWLEMRQFLHDLRERIKR